MKSYAIEKFPILQDPPLPLLEAGGKKTSASHPLNSVILGSSCSILQHLSVRLLNEEQVHLHHRAHLMGLTYEHGPVCRSPTQTEIRSQGAIILTQARPKGYAGHG